MKMQHVTILTKYFDEEIKFYEDYAGLKIVRDMRPHMDLVFLADGPEETKVEIIRNPEAEASGNQYILISPNPHVKFFYVKDPAGVRVQFVEG